MSTAHAFESASADYGASGPGQADRQLKVRVCSISDWAAIAPLWSQLANSSPHASFYLSVEWVSAWLQIFGEALKTEIVLFEQDGEPVGACLLNRAIEKRGPFRVKRVYLNTGGEDFLERTLMEYNNVLCRAGSERDVARALASHLKNSAWDEFAIEGICPGTVCSSLQEEFAGLRSSVSTLQSYYVDLARLRASGTHYLKSLSSNTRSQLLRSVRLYARMGPLRCEIAQDLETAQAFFNELCVLHQAYWLRRGDTGAFAPGRRLEFHKALIREASPKGTVHLIRVSAGAQTLGVLYNFVQQHKIYFFQSGFRYPQDPHMKPGLVTHACAIQHYLDLGFHEYDFLVGDARYKQQLARDSRPMDWLVLARPSLKLSLIEVLRQCRRRLRAK